MGVIRHWVRGAFLWMVLVLAIVPEGVFAQSAQDIARVADQSIGRVFAEGGTGSGFVLGQVPGSSDLHFATNQHVTDGSQKFTVAFLLNGKPVAFAATLVAASSGHDLAVLRLRVTAEDTILPKPIPIANRDIQKGEEAFAIGYPGVSDRSVNDRISVDGLETTLTVGTVSRVTNGTWPRKDTPLELVQHTAPINPGNSGGPLIDKCGSVIGVNTIGWTDSNEVYVASSSNSLGNYLKDSGVRYVAQTNPCRPGASQDAPTQTAEEPAPETDTGGFLTQLPLWGIVLIALVGVGGAGALAAVLTKSKPTTAPLTTMKTGGSSGGGADAGRVALKMSAKLPSGTTVPLSVTSAMLKSGVVIGRPGAAPLGIDAPKISRSHARLYQEGRSLMIVDLGSTNGTKVNGKALKAGSPVQINSAAVLEFGGVKVRLARPG